MSYVEIFTLDVNEDNADKTVRFKWKASSAVRESLNGYYISFKAGLFSLREPGGYAVIYLSNGLGRLNAAESYLMEDGRRLYGGYLVPATTEAITEIIPPQLVLPYSSLVSRDILGIQVVPSDDLVLPARLTLRVQYTRPDSLSDRVILPECIARPQL